MEKVCIYLRKSRADVEAEAHGELETLARHERILLDLAKQREYSVGAIYKEIVSGETIAARPVMQQLLKEVESGVWDGVLVVEVERLARGDTIDQGVVTRAFQLSDTKIITPLKTYNPNNEFDEEYFEFGLFMSRREYKTIKRRLNAGRLSSVKEGKYVGNKPPYGYERVKLEKEKGWTLAPVPEQAEVVKMIFDWYVNGVDGDRIGVSKIVRRLNDMHIPGQVRSTWSAPSVQHILENPVYIGKIVWNRRKSVKKIVDGQIVVTRPRSEDYDVCDGLHPALVSAEIFEKAQNFRRHNPPRPENRLRLVKNPLAGLVKCANCGRNMVRRPYGEAKKDTLICPYTECRTVGSSLESVESVILKMLEEIVAQYKLDIGFATGHLEERVSSLRSVRAENEKELAKLREQRVRQYDLLEQGIYSTDIFTERSAELGSKISGKESSIEKLAAQIEELQRQIENQRNFIPRCENLLEHYREWDPKTKNDVLKSLLEKIVYEKTERNAFREGNIPKFKLQLFPKVP